MRRTSLLVSAVLVASSLVGVIAGSAQADPVAGQIDGTPLPAGPAGDTAYAVSLGDGVVYALWGPKQTALSLYQTPADGSGAWEQVVVPSTGDPVTGVRSIDDGVVVQSTGTYDTRSCLIYRVVTPSEDWLAPSCATPNVGTGGDLVATQTYRGDLGRYQYDVYDAELGTTTAPLFSTASMPTLDGTWVWVVSGGVLRGHDTATSQDVSVPLGGSCLGKTSLLQVVGTPTSSPSYADLTCGTKLVLADLTGATRPFEVTGRPSLLGNGFLYVNNRVQDLSSSFAETDLTGFHARGLQWTPGRGWSGGWGADSSGSTSGPPMLAYLNDQQGVSVATLPSLGQPPSPATDTTKPSITSVSGSAPIVRKGASDPRDTELTFAWTAVDDDAAHPTYDVQYQAGDVSPGWHPLLDDQGLPEGPGLLDSSITYDAPNPTRVCFRVRATDRAGNRSPWTAPRCSSIDVTHPWMSDGVHDNGSVIPHVLTRIGRQQVSYRFHGSDDVSVASYDVQRRTAPVGDPLGPWRDIATGLRRGSLASTVRAGQESCFRARAHDRVGRVSAYGDRWCVVSPLDDRTLAIHGGSRREVHGALGDAVTRLRGPGQWLTSSRAVGHSVYVLATSDLGSCPQVTWGGQWVMHHRCGDVSERKIGSRWYYFYFAHTHRLHRGVIRVRAASASNWTDVDALAVGR